jgi:hypothetical protein
MYWNAIAALSFVAVHPRDISSHSTRHYVGGTQSTLSLSSSTSSSTFEPTMVPSEKYTQLLAWIEYQGAYVNPKLQIQASSQVGGGYGAFVAEAVEAEELLVEIPRDACITLPEALLDESCGETFATLMARAGPGGNTVVLAGYMAKEYLQSLQHAKDPESVEDSAYGPYLATLPWKRGINSQEHILYWSSEDIEKHLKGSMCYTEATELRREVQLAINILDKVLGPSIRKFRGEWDDSGFFPWQKLPPPPPEGPIEGLAEAITGAFVSILTRSFQDGDEASEKLVPFLDLLQHSATPNVRHAMRASDQTVEVRARQPLAAGSELFNQYRSEQEENMPPHRFFTRFGFVPSIPSDTILDLLQDQSSVFFAQTAEI